MGRPKLALWKEFVAMGPAADDAHFPDMACLYCHTRVPNARSTNLRRHVLSCAEMPDEVRLRLRQRAPTATQQIQGQSKEFEAGIAEPMVVLGKHPRSSSWGSQDTVARVLVAIRDVMAETLSCEQQELQLRKERLEFQREALAAKREDRRQAREGERRDRGERREADRQERLELARIENEKNLAFLEAVMGSSQQQG